MQQVETIALLSRFRSFVRRHWHILCVSLCLLVSFALGGLNVTELVLNVRYPAWVMIPWILVNVLLFLAVILLTLPYLLRAIRNRWEGDVVAIVVIVAVCCYLVLGLPPSAAGGAAGFSWVTFAYMAVLFVCDIIDIVIGIPQPKPKEKKEDK